MNNKSKFRFAILLFGVLSAFISTSCSGDNNGSLPDDPSQGGDALPVKQVSLSRKTAYGNDWIYYSLEKGKEVNVSEETHAENTDWDIAFNRYNVRTNSGASGKGKGGALLTNIKDMAACTTVPQGTFTVDASYTITAPGTGFPPPTMESTANEVLCKAITFAGPPPTYTPSDYVFIVRTASGKYAKLKAKSFYDDEGTSGIYSFEYAIQPNGSTNLN